MPQSNYLSTAHCGDVIIERFLDYLYLIPWQTKTKSRTEGSGADQMRRSFSGKLSPGYRLLRFAAVIIQNSKSSFQGGVMTDWMKQRDLLMEEALAFAQSVAANTQKMALTPVHQPDAADDFALSVQRPIAAKEPASQDKPDTEGAIIRKRLENFRANQERFRREREEYCTTTMAKARANQWTPQSRHHR
jgi:hypothetical protein